MTARISARRTAKLVVVIEDERWRGDAAMLSLIRKAARLGMAAPSYGDGLPSAKTKKRPAKDGPVSATLLLSNDTRLKSLNRDFRGKDKPTNVLSFPSDAPGYLGDIAIGCQTVQREARAQGKAFADHAAHLALHGALHLLGYDHEKKNEAEVMEALEIRLLARLGIASPYVLRPLPGRKKAA